jgi:hypothetical protein
MEKGIDVAARRAGDEEFLELGVTTGEPGVAAEVVPADGVTAETVSDDGFTVDGFTDDGVGADADAEG